MSRYFFYLIFLTMLANVVTVVPVVLLSQRYVGAISSMLLSVGYSLIVINLFIRSANKLSGRDPFELSGTLLPKLLTSALVVALIVYWYTAGAITLLYYSKITRRFINPEMPPYEILGLYLVTVLCLAQLRPPKLLYFLEIVLALHVPFILFITLKALSYGQMDWDAVKDIGTHGVAFPRWESLAAGTFVFSGYMQMLVFHRHLPRIDSKILWIIALVGVFNLLTTFFLPIGLLGADGADHYTYPWFSAADTLRIEFSIIERVFYLFLMLYTTISLLSSVLYWHASMQLGKKLLPKGWKVQGGSTAVPRWILHWGTVAIFAGATLWMESLMNEDQLVELSSFWLLVRLPVELVLLLFFILAARSGKHA